MAPGSLTGSCGVVSTSVPTLENSGHGASSVVPNLASASEQATFPSEALGLIENPSGKVTLRSLVSESDGATGLWGWGTLSWMSTPAAVSASVVEGRAASDGSKPRMSQPVTSGQGAVIEVKTPS